MDIEQELEKTFKIPTAFLAFLAIVIGILVLFFPYILNILIAFFLVVWGLMKAFELGKHPNETKTVESPTALTSYTQNSVPAEEEESSADLSNLSQAEPSSSPEVPEPPAKRRRTTTTRRFSTN